MSKNIIEPKITYLDLDYLYAMLRKYIMKVQCVENLIRDTEEVIEIKEEHLYKYFREVMI